jgi:hypothetical protein
MVVPSSSKVHVREIGDTDIQAVVSLLARGFPSRTRRFWSKAVECLSLKQPPTGYPRIGYMLESGGVPVGVLLSIFSLIAPGRSQTIRGNISSWYVEPQFRSIAPILVSRALRYKNVVFLNVSAAPHTRPILEAQGFFRYTNGLFMCIPALQLGGPDLGVQVADARAQVPEAADPLDHRLLMDHANYGCFSLWCLTKGRALPFVFRPRRLKGIIPCAQLVYCRDIEDFVRFAPPLGRYLARRGRPNIFTDANGPITELFGRYIDNRMPKYFRGAEKPRIGDLAYTETAMFGF